MTVLVPVNTAIEKLNKTGKESWLKPDILPFVVRYGKLYLIFLTL